MTIHDAVRDLRLSLGLSQQAFATQLGISMRAVQKYEKDRTPDARSLFALATVALTYGKYDFGHIFADALGLNISPDGQLVMSGLGSAEDSRIAKALPILHSVLKECARFREPMALREAIKLGNRIAKQVDKAIQGLSNAAASADKEIKGL